MGGEFVSQVPLVVGIDSNLAHEKHFLMMDYDDRLLLDALVIEIKRLQHKYSLGNAHIVETSDNHFSAFFFEECMDYFDALRIIHDTGCCLSFKRARMIFDEMTIRLTPKKGKYKPRLVRIVEGHEKEINRQQRAIRQFVLKAIDCRGIKG